MLFALYLRTAPTLFHCKRRGCKRKCNYYWLGFENLRNDRLAHRVYARTGRADSSTGEAAEPIDIQSDFDRAVRRARRDDRDDGDSTADAGGVCETAQTYRGRLECNTRNKMPATGR